MNVPDLSGKIALVTGASRGIGYHIAKKLAKAGAHIIAVARTIEGLEDLDDAIKKNRLETGKGTCTLVPLDLQDMLGIDRLGDAIAARWGRLDILIANAAILGVISPLSHIELKTFEKVMNINVTATWRVIRSVEALLHKAPAGRAVIVSSHVAHSARAFWAPYVASKLAVEAIARSWAHEIENSDLRVNIFYPGKVRTSMRAQAFPGEDPLSLPSACEVGDKIFPLILADLKLNGLLYCAKDSSWFSWKTPEPVV